MPPAPPGHPRRKVKAALRRRGGGVGRKDIAMFTRQLATMMKAGVPLLRSFEIVSKRATNPAVQKLLIEIKLEVETGSPLASAFRKFPLYFDNAHCNPGAGRRAGGGSRDPARPPRHLPGEDPRHQVEDQGGAVLSDRHHRGCVHRHAVIADLVIRRSRRCSRTSAPICRPTLIVMAISDWFVAYWYIIFPVISGSNYGFLEAWKRSWRCRSPWTS